MALVEKKEANLARLIRITPNQVLLALETEGFPLSISGKIELN